MSEEIIRGIVNRIYFDAEKGDFCAFSIIDENDENIKVAAKCRAPKEGEELELHGVYTVHKTYGRQFSASFFEILMPHTLIEAIAYINRLNISGLGEKSLQAIVEHFGDDLPDILRNDPEAFHNVPNLRKKVKKDLVDQLMGIGVLEGLNKFFAEHGFTGRWSKHIYDHLGSAALDIIKEDPYFLINLCEGFSFAMADKIALKLGLPPDSSKRMEAAVMSVLKGMPEMGHTCMPIDEYIEQCTNLVEGYADQIINIVEILIQNGSIYVEEHQDRQYIYLYDIFVVEHTAAELTRNLAESTVEANYVNLPELYDKFAKSEGITLATGQKEAIELALNNNIAVITGGPGTGKTTIIKALVKAFQKSGRSRVLLCAPTGRAAKRLTEATDYEATTIHRLLMPVGLENYEFLMNHDSPLEADVVIVDESSMLNIQLYQALIDAIPPTSTLVLVGDIDQLPPIGAGFVLRDLIEADIPHIKLKDIYRQQDGNAIINNAYLVNGGKMPILDADKEFLFREVDNLEDLMATVSAEYLNALAETNDVLDIQVLVPMRIKTAGSVNISKELQKIVNVQMSDEVKSCNINGQKFYVGDKVIQNTNNYKLDIYNGEIGIIYGMTKNNILVRFIDKDVIIPLEDATGLSLAYAITVHKSQGSEYSTVIIPFIRAYGLMLRRNLLYTAITRAKHKVIIVGSKAAIKMAVQTVDGKDRYTLFKERLIGEI